MIRLRPAMAAAALATALAHPAAAQTRDALGILREVAARARARTQGVQNYTVHTKTVGTSLVSYVSRGPDGEFQLQVGGGAAAGTLADMAGWGDGLLLMLEGGLTSDIDKPDAGDGVRYEGLVTSGGAPAHRIAVDLPADSAEGSEGAVPQRFALDFDTATLLTRRVEARMAGPTGAPASLEMELGDWRPVGGMMLPFRRNMVIRGLRAEVMGADTIDAAQTLAQGRAMLAGLPKDRQETMRQMLDLMEGLFKRDEMVMEEIVTEVAVNQGPPPGVALGPARKN